MKKFLKITLTVTIIIGAIFGGWYAYYKFFAGTASRNSMTLLPEDAVFVVQTSNLTKAWAELSKSELWKYMTQNPVFKDIEQDIEMVNKYVRDNPAINMMVEGRELVMSAHMTSGKDWDFVFIVDLQDVTMLKGGLKSALSLVSGFIINEREFKGEKIIEMIDEKNPKSKIYMAIVDNLFVTTFTGSLMEKIIENKENTSGESKGNLLKNNAHFKEVTQNLGGKKLFSFYFNYKQMSKFSLSFFSEPSETIDMISQSLGYSALNIYLEDERLSFDGFTNVDSVGSYIKALAGVKPGTTSADKIISNQASMYFSLGFEDFMQFYNNLITQFEAGNAEDMEDINKGINITEKFLGISLQENFFDWIGNEIAFVKLRPDTEKNTRLEDVVVLFHANDIDRAKEGWGKIIERINKRTVVKFKTENYKNFEISILERRGIFKIFLGDMFEQLEKPYYTFIEDFLVMSNSLETLKTVIDDYVKGQTLSHSEKFMDFKENFEGKSNLSVFIQSPKMYQNLYYYSTPEDKNSIKENKEFILSFNLIGFQLSSQGNMFATKLIAMHDPEAVKSDEIEVFEKQTTENRIFDEIDSLSFKIVLPSDSLKNNGLYVQYFPESEPKKIFIEGNIKNDNINGIWKTYYESGYLKSSVNYTDGKINGEAFFYFDSPDTKKMISLNFEDDVIEGEFNEFFETGARKSKINYVSGKKDGEAEFYHKTGSIKIDAEFKDNLNHGKWIYFDENGKEIGKEKWKNGSKK